LKLNLKPKFIFAIAIIAFALILPVFAGCAGDSGPALEVGGAAQNLQERFADLFEDAEQPAAIAAEPVTEPPPAPAITQLPEPPDPLEPSEADEITVAGADAGAEDFVPDLSYEPEPPEITEPEPIEVAEPVELFAITPTGRRFHRESCHHARNAAELLTREAAATRGLDPCRTCNP